MSWSNMTMSAEETAAINFLGDDKIFVLGAQFMACLFDSLFCGVLLCQLTHWIPNAKKDSRIVQVLVAFGATAALSTTIYTWANYLMAFVYDFGMYERFTSFNLLGIYPILDGLTVVPVQIFFAERSVRINGNSMICAIVNGLLIAATFAAAVGVTAVTRGQDMIEPTDAIKVIAVLWPTICTTAHVFITTSIVTGLFKTRTTGDGSNKIINRVVAVSLESQLPATIFAVAAMTAIASNPSGPLVPFIIIVHPKVFMVGCLAMVNLRHNWRLTGKIPSSFNSAGSMYRPGLMSTSTSAQSHGVPTTPPLGPGLVRGFSGPSEDYKFDPESGCGLDGMNIKIKRPGEL